MPSPSKEEEILKLILENSPLREWHFKEIVKEAKVTNVIANKWLKRYVKEGLLNHKKERGKFPYFTAGRDNYTYYSLKRVYALEQLHKSGLIPKLLSLNAAKTIILFGSIIKGDWYKDSDIDIFVFGKPKKIEKYKYELKLKRNIELHVFETQEEIKEVKTGLIDNIINGYIIRGKIQDFAEVS